MKTRVFKMSKSLVKLSLLFMLASCNKSDYFQKDYLANAVNDIPVADGPSSSEDYVDRHDHEDQQDQEHLENPGPDHQDDIDLSRNETEENQFDDSISEDPFNNEGSFVSENQENNNTSGGSVTADEEGQGEVESVNGPEDSLTDSSPNEKDQDDLSNGVDQSDNTEGSIVGAIDDCNQGHGNDYDRIDESNPVIGLVERCKEEKFFQRKNQKDLIDIIWIVDNSGSMQDEQESLAKNFGSFIDAFLKKEVNFTMSILTTDREKNQRSKLLNESLKKLNSNSAQENLKLFEEDFMNLIKVGTNGSSKEQGLGALNDFIKDKGKSFLRKDAQLAVICVTDEEDQSSISTDKLVLDLANFKGSLDKIKFYSIVDLDLKNRGRGISTGYTRYADVSNATQGLILNIQHDFHQSLNLIGENIVNLLDSFQLKETPEISSIKVYVQGLEEKNFLYIPETNSIRFQEESIPSQGVEIKVRYKKID